MQRDSNRVTRKVAVSEDDGLKKRPDLALDAVRTGGEAFRAGTDRSVSDSATESPTDRFPSCPLAQGR